ncbi:MAG: 5-methyltetrahydropteroyltriglutamate--homocysteine S-methyltransferase [Rickettsiales bacterium]|jgi:5-methyltetrahydropteroyltriglutamate--homocysteine methyltransferase|nr:5-methyltetrahydropteroyltriglutamate--homocysteine S-methyltransferase [Rickettsiales bacterium]
MIKLTTLGFPRIGANRELKKSVEKYWKGQLSEIELKETANNIKISNWNLHIKNNIDYIPNDFSYYDHILDASCTFGNIPPRYNHDGSDVDLDLYFSMARGKQSGDTDVVAMEMTKWFDTNYHYIVPEFDSNTEFKLSYYKIFEDYKLAKDNGIETKPVLIGPISYLYLGKSKDSSNKYALLDNLVDCYTQILTKLNELGCKDIQIDEPILSLDLEDEVKTLYKNTYSKLDKSRGAINIHLASYFESYADNFSIVDNLPVYSVHFDITRSKDNIEFVKLLSTQKKISLGVIDGRNIWKANYQNIIDQISNITDVIDQDRLIIASSCSLLHSPVDLDAETNLDSEIKSWLAFATQKISELRDLKTIINQDSSAKTILEENKETCKNRAVSTKIHDINVKERMQNLNPSMFNRYAVFSDRIKEQNAVLNLPSLPTTTIGSFPQTKELRQVRARFKKGEVSDAEYNEYLKSEIKQAVKFQEEIDLDVLVHGEAERNDMVEYFGEQLSGFAFTKNGWVQSYGSRCVKPPIIFGDVSRKSAMTVEWTKYAQSLTDRRMKGMLTGPITILQWSFVRDDQPRRDTCYQIGLAIRDEVTDLEDAGIKIIQIDEPAIREGLPLRRADWDEYLKWAVSAFKLSACSAANSTQIHTHMCYSEFNDIMSSIAALDADVISIETSRSDMELLDAFTDFNYPNDIGPGVYDIHSPRVPDVAEMEDLLKKALNVLKPEQLWVNPDCGLKTRGWPEVKSALIKMVTAAKNLRSKVRVVA